MTNGGAPAGWYRDPTGHGDGRYWNGVNWTEMVNGGGATINVPIDPQQAQTPPLPGTQIAKPGPYAAGQTVNVSTPNRTGLGAIIVGIVVAVVGIVILVAINDDSSDETPTPGSDQPAVTGTPAPQPSNAPAAPPTDGG